MNYDVEDLKKTKGSFQSKSNKLSNLLQHRKILIKIY